MAVVLADRDGSQAETRAKQLRASGARAIAVAADVSHFSEVEALAGRAYDEFGAVHILCNNAGVSAQGLRTRELTLETWEWLLGVNLWGVIHGLKAFVPRMLAEGQEGHVVNTASMAGLINGTARGAPYSVSKHGVVALTESLYRELKMDHAAISASVLCPGWVNTALSTTSAQTRPRSPGEPPPPSAASAGFEQIPGVLDPECIAAQVLEAIGEDRFYILPAQQQFLDWMHMGHRRVEEGRNPAVPRS